jgi:hypothetical protein
MFAPFLGEGGNTATGQCLHEIRGIRDIHDGLLLVSAISMAAG